MGQNQNEEKAAERSWGWLGSGVPRHGGSISLPFCGAGDLQAGTYCSQWDAQAPALLAVHIPRGVASLSPCLGCALSISEVRIQGALPPTSLSSFSFATSLAHVRSHFI